MAKEGSLCSVTKTATATPPRQVMSISGRRPKRSASAPIGICTSSAPITLVLSSTETSRAPMPTLAA